MPGCICKKRCRVTVKWQRSTVYIYFLYSISHWVIKFSRSALSRSLRLVLHPWQEFSSWKWELPIRISAECGWGLPDSNDADSAMEHWEWSGLNGNWSWTVVQSKVCEKENLFFGFAACWLRSFSLECLEQKLHFTSMSGRTCSSRRGTSQDCKEVYKKIQCFDIASFARTIRCKFAFGSMSDQRVEGDCRLPVRGLPTAISIPNNTPV